MLIGDFNVTIENKNLFLNSFGLECLIKKPTGFQFKNPSCFDLTLTNKKDLFKTSNVLFIMNLDGSESIPVGDIPIDMLKQTIDIHLPIKTQIINMSIDNNCYPDNLKLAEVSPVFKKKDDLDIENFRPVSILSHVSKDFERIMYQRIEDFIKDKLSNLLTVFRKNQNTQHCLMSMLE